MTINGATPLSIIANVPITKDKPHAEATITRRLPHSSNTTPINGIATTAGTDAESK